jgi:hypothetical protein
MELLVHYPWVKRSVEAVSSMAWSGIEVTKMITMIGSHLETLAGAGMICFLISKR